LSKNYEGDNRKLGQIGQVEIKKKKHRDQLLVKIGQLRGEMMMMTTNLCTTVKIAAVTMSDWHDVQKKGGEKGEREREGQENTIFASKKKKRCQKREMWTKESGKKR